MYTSLTESDFWIKYLVFTIILEELQNEDHESLEQEIALMEQSKFQSIDMGIGN